jgi:hypothetical protein
MSESDNAQNQVLECLRLAAECRNFIAEVPMQYRRHYWRMACMWEQLAQEMNSGAVPF